MLIKKSWWLTIFSFLLPGSLFLLAMAFIGAAPFGDETILLRDSVGQYIDFFGYLKSVMRGENDLLYTFSKALGGDMLSLASYYLISPFNVLFAFATTENTPMFYTAIVVLKLSACGLTFYLAAKNRYGAKFTHLIFSTAYALSAYNVLYQWNILWLDGVIVLPLVGLGVEWIWSQRSSLLYILSLGYALLTNFYIGYMLCIASVIFSFVYFVIYNGSFRERLRIFCRYVFASCIGGLSSAFVWLPAFLSLQSGRAQFNKTDFSLSLNFNPLELCAKLVAGSGGAEQLGNGLPHIFCGTLVLFLVLTFFFTRQIPAKTRIAVLFSVLAVTGSFFLQATNLVWHGFSPNISFNYRYSFILSYLLLAIGQYVFSSVLPCAKSTRIAAAMPLMAIYAFLLIKDYNYVAPIGIFAAALVVVAILVLDKIPGKKAFAAILICIISFAEIGLNCYLLLDSVVGEVWTLRISDWQTETTATSTAIDYVKEQDSAFYRLEKTYRRSHNDPMFYAYNGLSHFSSTEQASIPRFLEKMGLKNYHDFWTYYNTGSTAEVDSLLGVKYILSKEDMTAAKGYERIKQIDDIGIYQNPYALQPVMFAQADIEEVSMEQPDYFALHNEIWSNISGSDVQILHPIDCQAPSLVNMRQVDPSSYEKIDASQMGSLRYTFTATQELPIYFYFTAPYCQNVTITVNGQDFGVYFDDYRWDMTNIGIYTPGEEITVELVAGADTINLTQAFFYYEDLGALQTVSKKIQSSAASIQRISASHIEGQVSAPMNGYLLFTIPYSTGWHLEIDGVTAETTQLLDTLLAAEIQTGTHTYTLRYIPVGLTAGIVLSISAIFIAVLDFWCRKRTKANP